MRTVFVALGSNVGHREDALTGGLRAFASRCGLTNVRCSRLIETDPSEGVGGGRFLNAVASGALVPDLAPEQLLAHALHVEAAFGRARGEHGLPRPRTLDIDVLAVIDINDEYIMRAQAPVLPHPRMHLRRFVLEPLGEVAPWFVHPVLGVGPREMLDRLGPQGDR